MGTNTEAPTPVRFWKLIADPLRWELLTCLAESDRRVGDLTERVGREQNLVSYHLSQLRSAGLVSGRRSTADGRDTYYRLDLGRYAQLLDAGATALDPGLRLADASQQPVDRRALAALRTHPPAVLFLCTGNSARSQIAEALLQHRSGGVIVARSAGSHPKPVHRLAVEVLAERGIDIGGRSSKHLDEFAGMRFDRVVTLCDKVKEVCPEIPGAVTVHWSMPDPAAEAGGADAAAAFARTADEIDERVGRLIARLVHDERNHHDHR
ncbi:MAG: metalloregulator ArsR/SmtB family transcription factor [Aquihabitans sp.]